MRINKKLVPKWTSSKDRYSDQEYVDVRFLSAGITIICLIGLALLSLVWAYTYAVPSAKETNFYDSRCAIIAAGQKHYTARLPRNGAGQHNMQCVVAPDWHRVNM